MPRPSRGSSWASDAWGLRDLSQVTVAAPSTEAAAEYPVAKMMLPTRPRFYKAPACGVRGGLRKSLGAPRRAENRKCQLDSFDKSTTVLCAERLSTQASDAFTAEAARALALGAKKPLRTPKDEEYNHIQAWHDKKNRAFEAWRP
mmetsp:Transcript_67520/g.162062  ORF Transcript_67520/g.162062 Transcript_67520/m.162062 type:complete len:145 (+) Transcript_67520:103-537(+)